MEETKRVRTLLEYIRQLAGLRQRAATHIDEEAWHIYYDALPVDPKRIHALRPEDEDFSGVLLEVEKPAFSPCPELPFELIGWIRTPQWRSFETADIEPYEERQKKDARLGLVTERFLDSGVRIAAFEDWKRRRTLWRAGELVKARTQELFMTLYDIYNRMKQSESLELLLGNGFLYSGLDSSIDHPLLLRRVKLAYDKRGRMQVVDSSLSTEVYADILSDMPGIDGEGIRAFSALVEEGVHPASGDFPEVLEHLAPALSPNCRYAEHRFGLLPKDWYILYPHTVLFLHRHGAGTARAIGAIAQDIDAGGTVPPALLAIASGGKKPETAQQDKDAEALLADARGEAEDILLAQPANAEQLVIARLLESADAVAVEGPPGTGKTHTIANLLGHFLAKGQHVLVTSSRSRALSVLKEKLPEGIQDLCVSLLEDDRADMERSVAGIEEMLSRASTDTLRREAEQLAEERKNILGKLQGLRAQREAIIRAEAKRDALVLGGKAWSLSRMADFLHRHPKLAGRLPEPIEGAMPLTEAELSALYATNPLFSRESLAEMAEELPDLSELPGPEEVTRALREAAGFAAKEEEILKKLPYACRTEEGDIATAAGSVLEEGQELQASSLAAADALYGKIDFDLLEKAWAREAILAGRQGGAQRAVYDILSADIEAVQRAKGQALTQFFGRLVEPAEDLPLDEALLQTLSDMADAFGEGQKLPLFAKLRHPRWVRVAAAFRIDGRPLSGRADCQLALQYVHLALAREKARREWDMLLTPHGMEPSEKLASPTDDADDVMAARWREVASLLSWYEEVFGPLLKELFQAGVAANAILPQTRYMTPREKLLSELRWLREDYGPWLALLRLHYLEREGVDALGAARAACAGRRGALARRMEAALEAGSAEGYAAEYARLSSYESLAPAFEKRRELLSRLSAAAPVWAHHIAVLDEGYRGGKPPEEAEAAWLYAVFTKELAKAPPEDVETLGEEIESASMRLRSVTAELAQKRAWQHLISSVAGTSLQSALVGWSKATKKLGKGKGKYAARHLREARACMQEARMAVPAWIMPLSRVYEHLTPGGPKFDVIICDEASQADILALPLLYFGKKVIIVGDDKQTSPAAIGVEAEEVQHLMGATIDAVLPHASLYTLDTSLYDIAQMHFSGAMLTEHFRSVPEIIGFCNQLSYDGRIRPLRESGALQPLVDCYLRGRRTGKTNEEEARYIVALLAACLEEEAYQGATFGAISLLGTEQAKRIQELAAERIGITALEEHGFLAGGPAEFQGDERDIIFLSFVDARDEGEEALRLYGEGKEAGNRRRMNVAVSRARDQIFLVHSMKETDLKLGDLRRSLLAYAKEPRPEAAQGGEREETSLETAVSRALTARGFAVRKHFYVGAYPVDLAVASSSRRVAIACDGERWLEGAAAKEKQRQEAVLERLGWHFLHVRGSAWYRDPEGALDRLVEELRALGVLPEEESEALEGSLLATRIQERAFALLEEWGGEK